MGVSRWQPQASFTSKLKIWKRWHLLTEVIINHSVLKVPEHVRRGLCRSSYYANESQHRPLVYYLLGFSHYFRIGRCSQRLLLIILVFKINFNISIIKKRKILLKADFISFIFLCNSKLIGYSTNTFIDLIMKSCFCYN